MLLVLERLSPAERAAFVLHDVFQFSFEEMATIVDKTPAACRQLASRARRHVRREASPARFTVDPDDLSRVVDRFIAAATAGDRDALLQVLDPNVVGHTDAGGILPAPRGLIVGRDRVARSLVQFLRSFRIRLAPIPVNGGPGALAYQDGRLLAVIGLAIREERIVQIHGMANPFKLAYAASLVGAETIPPAGEQRTPGNGNPPSP